MTRGTVERPAAHRGRQAEDAFAARCRRTVTRSCRRCSGQPETGASDGSGGLGAQRARDIVEQFVDRKRPRDQLLPMDVVDGDLQIAPVRLDAEGRGVDLARAGMGAARLLSSSSR